MVYKVDTANLAKLGLIPPCSRGPGRVGYGIGNLGGKPWCRANRTRGRVARDELRSQSNGPPNRPATRSYFTKEVRLQNLSLRLRTR